MIQNGPGENWKATVSYFLDKIYDVVRLCKEDWTLEWTLLWDFLNSENRRNSKNGTNTIYTS